MLNGSGISTSFTNGSTIQGCLIVPVIDTTSKYYVFFLAHAGTVAPPHLTYSVVDMTLDGGLGGIETNRKDIILYNYPLPEGMIAIPGNNCDVWLLTHTKCIRNVNGDPDIPGNDTASRFIAWHITAQGVDPTPVISPPAGELSGSINQEHGFRNSFLAVSPNKEYIAITSYHLAGNAVNQGLLLCKFDANTGIVSDGLWLNDHRSNTAVCFSPDNTKLYAAQYQGSIIQYDVSSYNLSAITSSAYSVSDGNFFGLRLYRDTVYSLPFYSNSNSISTINSPNISGAGCDYQANAITLLAGTQIRLFLSNEVVFPDCYEISTVYDTICYTQRTGYTTKKLSV